MKKIFAPLLMLMSISASAFASVGVKQNNSNIGTATDINFSSDGFNVTSDGSTATVTFGAGLLANGRVGGASTMSSSSTFIGAGGLSYSYVAKRIGGGGGLDTTSGVDSYGTFTGSRLPNGIAGQLITFYITACQSGGTWALYPVNSVTFTRITFSAVAQYATLLYVSDAVGWVVTNYSGANVTINQLP